MPAVWEYSNKAPGKMCEDVKPKKIRTGDIAVSFTRLGELQKKLGQTSQNRVSSRGLAINVQGFPGVMDADPLSRLVATNSPTQTACSAIAAPLFAGSIISISVRNRLSIS